MPRALTRTSRDSSAAAVPAARTLRALHEVAMAVAGTVDPQALATVVVEHLKRLFDANSTVLYWLDDRHQTLQYVADSERTQARAPLQPGRGAVGRAVLTKEPVIVQEYDAWEFALPEMVAQGVKSCVAAPLLVGEQVMGAIVAQSDQHRRWTRADAETLRLFGAQVVPSLMAAHLYGQAEERRAAAEALLEVAAAVGAVLDPQRLGQLAVDRAQALLGSDAVHLWIWDADSQMLRSLARHDPFGSKGQPDECRPGESVAGQAYIRGQPVIVEDYDRWEHARPSMIGRGVASAMGVPLQVNERLVGSLVVHNYSRQTFDDSHVELLTLFAAQLAPALESARLYAASQQAAEEIRRLNAELEQRVVERTAELQAANHELEAFSYSVAHDLRSPLRSMDGFCQVLVEEYGSQLDDRARHYLDRVRQGSQRMASLMDDLLRLARLSRTEMRREPIDLSEMARTIARDLADGQPERRVTFEIADNLTAYGDQRLVRLALEHLLGNAWKFTSGHSTARVEFSRTEVHGRPAFFVRDDGAGFDMAYANKLFEPFQRLHRAMEFEGSGIGLAIVRRIVDRHGGRVWAEAEVGSGACFYFRL